MAHKKEREPIEAIKETQDKELLERLSHLRYMHSVAERYKDSIYSRSQMLLAICGVLFALTINVANIVFTNTDLKKLPAWYEVLIAGSIISEFIAAIMIIKTILPHKNIRHVSKIISNATFFTQNSNNIKLLSSFNHVCTTERDEFKNSMGKATVKDLFEDLVITYYNLCHIVNKRYNDLRSGIIFLLFGFIMFMLEILASFLIFWLLK